MLASNGARVATRNITHSVQHRTGGTHHGPGPGLARGLHIPAAARTHARVPVQGQAQKLFVQSRNLLARFFTQLTAPGLRLPSVAQNSSSLLTTPARNFTTIQQGFSQNARFKLSRPLQTYHLPRAPTVPPRSIAQVGLGTARNFSTARPIFQNIVENIPVTGRAFYEADWELNLRKERTMRKPTKAKSSKKQATKEMLKPRDTNVPVKATKADKENEVQTELNHYFPTPAIPNVTTCLLIPMAPTPTERVPLAANPSPDRPLLPMGDIASIHVSHQTHSLRVHSLFSRLDAANVWDRNVECSAYSHGAGREGVCTVLKVEFHGWTKAEVRSVIGESGSGWCVLEETSGTRDTSAFGYDDEDSLSDTSSNFTGSFEDSRCASRMELEDPLVDPSQSLVLPTLDFSSSFLQNAAPNFADPEPTPSEAPSEADSYAFVPSDEFDPWMEVEAESDSGGSSSHYGEDNWAEAPVVNGRFGFSSRFSQQLEARA